MIYYFYIELQETNPLVWRRLVIAPGYTVYQLHMAIQGAFGWGNSHLFKFCENGLEDPAGYGHVFKDRDIDDLTKDAKKTSIVKAFSKASRINTYVYDFGDYWLHTIKLEKIEAREFEGAYCIGGSGACPPDDVGGVSGYAHMLEIMAYPKSPERKEFITWLGLGPGEKWKADFFSVRDANIRLALLEW